MSLGRWQWKNKMLKRAHTDYKNRELHKQRTTLCFHPKDGDKDVPRKVNKHFKMKDTGVNTNF